MQSERLSSKPICIGTGLVALDVVINGDGKERYISTGGSCGNVMTILAFLGWSSTIIARIGQDTAGRLIREELHRLNVDIEESRSEKNALTPVIVQKNSVLNGGGVRHSFTQRCPVCGGWFPSFSPVLKKDAESFAQIFPHHQFVFYFDRVSPGILELVKSAKKDGAFIVFEPSNKIESDDLTQAIALSDVVKYSVDRYESMPTKKGLSVIEIRTEGKSGLSYSCGGKWKHFEAYEIEGVKDQSGAGDWCTAGIIHKLTSSSLGKQTFEFTDDRIEESLKFGQALGALNCLFEGARGLMSLKAEVVLENVSVLRHHEKPQLKLQKRNSKLPRIDELCKHCMSAT